MANPTAYPIMPLPPSVRGTQASLSPAARSEVQALMGPRLWPWLRSAAISWLSIFALIAAAVWINHLAFSILAMLLIATRQMALAYLLHEQTHYLAFRNKYGDLITNLLVCYPLLFVTVEKYAQVHITHHRHYFSDADPDFNRKSGDEWAQPQSWQRLLLSLLRDVTGLNIIKLIRGKKMASNPYPRRWQIPGWVQPAYYLLIAALLTWFSLWPLFLLYWLLPLLTFFQIISRLMALCEHRYNIAHGSVEETTPLIILPWWQKLLMPDLNFGYHVYHHYYPGVSFGNLPKVHEIFQREGLVDEAQIYRGTWDYFRRAVIGQPELVPAAATPE